MEKIWLKNYQPGVPEVINPDNYSSVAHMFEDSCKKYDKQIAYNNFGTDLSYRSLELYSRYFAAFLQGKLELKKQDRIAIMMPNVLQYPIVLFGAIRAGLIVVNINPLYTPYELAHQINDSGAETIIVLENFAGTVSKVLSETCLKNVIITRLGDLHGFAKSMLMNTINKYVKKNVVSYNLPNHYDFSATLDIGSKYKFNNVELENSDIAFLQYTGGTTGTSKGAILTHRNMLANLEQAKAWVSPMMKEGQEVVITALPLYHIFSLTANCLIFQALGAKNILITNPRDIKGFIKEFQKYPFTFFSGVNTLFNALLQNKMFEQIDFSNLKVTLAGGMSLQKNVAEKWHKMTGCHILEAYGLTEAAPAVTINPLNSAEFNGSVGLPVSSTEISIRDDKGKIVEQGEPGELWVRGPQVMQGYWNRPDETELVLEDNWLKTGDMATVDQDGYVYIVDRIKDLILVSGYNVYPNEVEEVLVSHSDVLEAGVIGQEDRKGGEAVVAFVVLKNPGLSERDLRRHCIERLTRYKTPKKIYFIDELPKNNVGKILRKDLRKMVPK